MDTLRDYQTALVKAIRSSIIRATLDAGNTALFLAPRREVVDQTSDKLTREGEGTGSHEAGAQAARRDFLRGLRDDFSTGQKLPELRR